MQYYASSKEGRHTHHHDHKLSDAIELFFPSMTVTTWKVKMIPKKSQAIYFPGEGLTGSPDWTSAHELTSYLKNFPLLQPLFP